MTPIAPTAIEIAGTLIFAAAIVHTFLTKYFLKLAHAQPAHAGLWHLLGEVEVVFGFWALVFVGFIAANAGLPQAVSYLESQNYTEPAFVFAVMVIAASRPVLYLAQRLVIGLSAALPLPRGVAFYFVLLSVTPLLGSLITEPAAMTLAALMLRDRVFTHGLSSKLQYATLGVLFVNISIGGTLTHFAAPPVLMVAGTWGWDAAYMFTHFGWKAAIAVLVNAAAVSVLFRAELSRLPANESGANAGVPTVLIVVHLLFLAAVVAAAHHVVIVLGLLLFFLGVAQGYERHQDRLILREALLVAFFLAGLVTLGSPQRWWLQDLIAGLSPNALFFGATALTAITDNAALTYLGSLIDGTSEAFKYALVAGAVTGGGLTVIANAPNPAGFSILGPSFKDGAINPLQLLLAALAPTLIAVVAFTLL